MPKIVSADSSLKYPYSQCPNCDTRYHGKVERCAYCRSKMVFVEF